MLRSHTMLASACQSLMSRIWFGNSRSATNAPAFIAPHDRDSGRTRPTGQNGSDRSSGGVTVTSGPAEVTVVDNPVWQGAAKRQTPPARRSLAQIVSLKLLSTAPADISGNRREARDDLCQRLLTLTAPGGRAAG